MPGTDTHGIGRSHGISHVRADRCSRPRSPRKARAGRSMPGQTHGGRNWRKSTAYTMVVDAGETWSGGAASQQPPGPRRVGPSLKARLPPTRRCGSGQHSWRPSESALPLVLPAAAARAGGGSRPLASPRERARASARTRAAAAATAQSHVPARRDARERHCGCRPFRQGEARPANERAAEGSGNQ